MSNLSLLSFPRGIGTKTHPSSQPYMFFTSYESKNAIESTGQTGHASGANAGIAKSYIALYIPPNALKTEFKAEYGGKEGAATKAAAGAAIGRMATEGLGATLLAGLKGAGLSIGGAALKAAENKTGMLAAQGIAVNNHMALTYKGPSQFRSHDFAFSFFPKNGDEADELQKILEDFDEYITLVEYEWAPIDRLGLEVELPFSFYSPNQGSYAPANNLNSIKMAAQYSFCVSKKHEMSMAFGYIQEFTLTDFENYGDGKLFTGNVYNPFFIAAKRLGANFHSLLYTGPVFEHHFETNAIETHWQINSNVHYMIPGSRNFIGVEFNKEVHEHDFEMTIRPQMRVEVTDQLLIGIVTGIPISKENERFSSFLRLIYEP